MDLPYDWGKCRRVKYDLFGILALLTQDRFINEFFPILSLKWRQRMGLNHRSTLQHGTADNECRQSQKEVILEPIKCLKEVKKQ